MWSLWKGTLRASVCYHEEMLGFELRWLHHRFPSPWLQHPKLQKGCMQNRHRDWTVVTTEGGHCPSGSLFGDFVGSAGFVEQNVHFPSDPLRRATHRFHWKVQRQKCTKWGMLFDILLIVYLYRDTMHSAHTVYFVFRMVLTVNSDCFPKQH
jgi:hypothetical protein